MSVFATACFIAFIRASADLLFEVVGCFARNERWWLFRRHCESSFCGDCASPRGRRIARGGRWSFRGFKKKLRRFVGTFNARAADETSARM
jgi:hypothetical protein